MDTKAEPISTKITINSYQAREIIADYLRREEGIIVKPTEINEQYDNGGAVEFIIEMPLRDLRNSVTEKRASS